MSCAEILEAVARGRADDPSVANHLAVCPDCRARAESARALGRYLADPVMWEEPSPVLADRVLSAIDTESGRKDRPPRWWKPLPPASAAFWPSRNIRRIFSTTIY